MFSFPESGSCQVAALLKLYEMLRSGGLGRPQDPVFTFPSGKFLTTAGFNAILRILMADICDLQRETLSGHGFPDGVPRALPACRI